MIESTAAFAARARAMGILDTEVTCLATAKYDSFAAFAFIVPYNPLATDDTVLKEALTLLLGSEPTLTQMGRYRRLQFESHTLVLSDTKVRMERTDDAAPRKMPGAERSARHREQTLRLVSTQITQDNEPSHALLDLAQQLVEDAQIKYLSLDKCTSRVQELQGVKVDSSLVKDSNGAIRIVAKEEGPSADLSTDYRIRQAFLRRGLALDQSQLIGFDVHERWVNSLFSAMSRTPPPGYSAVSLDQVLAADRELFVCLGEECRDGVGLDGRGRRIVEEAMKALMTDARIAYLILPLPSGSSSSSSAAKQPSLPVPGLPSLPGKGKRALRTIAKRNAIANNTTATTTKGKGKGKGKTSSMPQELQGCWSRVDGEQVCFNFNLGRCSESVAVGAKCSKGVHKCCGVACKGLHSYSQCPNKR